MRRARANTAATAAQQAHAADRLWREIGAILWLVLAARLRRRLMLCRWGARNPYATASDALALVVFCSVVANEEADADKGGSEVGWATWEGGRCRCERRMRTRSQGMPHARMCQVRRVADAISPRSTRRQPRANARREHPSAATVAHALPRPIELAPQHRFQSDARNHRHFDRSGEHSVTPSSRASRSARG